jgi:hypothetical protein
LGQSSPETPNQRTGFLTYEKNGMRLNYPSDWTVSEDILDLGQGEKAPSVRFDSKSGAEKYSADISIDVLSTHGKTPDIVFGIVLDTDKELKKFDLQSSERFDFKGNSAYKIAFTYNDKDYGSLEAMETIVVNGDKYYWIQYTAQPDEYNIFLPTVENLISSFQII